jgi:hypothetical protein
MRAAQTHSVLATIRRLDAPERDEILSRIGEANLRRAQDALQVAWLPMALHMLISDHVRDVIGPERNVVFWRDAMSAAFQRPFLKSFVAMTVSLFGLTPAGLLRRVDGVYTHVTRELGAMRYEPVDERSGRAVLTGFPARSFRFICYVEGLQGCLAATIVIGGGSPHVAVAAHDEQGNVSYDVSW